MDQHELQLARRHVDRIVTSLREQWMLACAAVVAHEALQPPDRFRPDERRAALLRERNAAGLRLARANALQVEVQHAGTVEAALRCAERMAHLHEEAILPATPGA